MALLVESGAGVAGAESYLAPADADAHHAAFGWAGWAAASIQAREAALRRATAAIDGLFAGRWRGDKAVPWTVNVLAWPRRGVADDAGPIVAADAIPHGLKVAVAEAARLELEQPGALAEAGRRLRRFALGPLAVEMADGGDAAGVPPAVALPLAPLLRPTAPAPRLASASPAGAAAFRVGMHDGGRP
ncbi:DnaT-like ssDNA-binding protein [Stella sp.]|uniref:DnaT-like ssDNA-binding protein n=1 Tax=Stella sp. TaxID=2912054 RepID=UPI0035B489F7